MLGVPSGPSIVLAKTVCVVMLPCNPFVDGDIVEEDDGDTRRIICPEMRLPAGFPG